MNKNRKNKKTVIKCSVCGEEKEYAEWEVKEGRKYCSYECYHKAPRLDMIKWTDKEKRILRERFVDSSKEEILALIPRKSYDAIYRLASTYGLKKSKIGFFKSLEQRSSGFKPWTDEELKVLINRYANTMFKELLLLLPNRSEHSIRVKAHRLGLKKEEEIISQQIRERIYGENWREIEISNLYPSEFDEELKELIRKRDNYECQICRVPQRECEQKLSIHHINYDKKNCSSENLISLCTDCHIKTNSNRDFWEIMLSNIIIRKGVVNGKESSSKI